MDDLRNRLRKYDDYVPPAGGRPKSLPKIEKEPELEIGEEFNLFDEPIQPKKVKKKRTKTKKKRRGRKVLIFGLLLALVAGGIGYAKYKHLGLFKEKKQLTRATEDSAVQSTSATPTAPTQPTIIRFVATGDMLPYATILHAGDLGAGKYDFSPMFKNLGTYFTKSDIRFCNQATPSGGVQFGVTGYPAFNAPLEWQQAIEGAGCNLIGLASNNINDKGQAAVDVTVGAWGGKSSIFAVAGANKTAEEQNAVRYFTVKGLKFAFVAYTVASNVKPTTLYGVNLYSDSLAQTQIKEAKGKADFVVVSMHWGKEDSDDVTPEQETIAQQLTNLGVNVVLGHGSHRVQPVKLLSDADKHQTLVWYSLGNSLNAQLPIESLIGGLAVMDIDVNTKKVGSSFLPLYVHYEWTAEQKKKEDLLSRKNFGLFALDEAAPQLSASQNGTTVEVQTIRITQILNKFTSIPLLTSKQFLDTAPSK